MLRIDTFPAFVKRPISTASSGVRRTLSRSELDEVSKVMGVGEYELLVQTQADGPLAMVQAIADNGRLVAHHANLRVLEGVGGGASLKESVVLPGLYELLRKLVAALNWHGALSMDVIVTTDGPVVIDVNPRLVEPMNAFFAGVDLVGAMLDLARHQTPDEQSVGRAGIRSRQLLLAILGAAQNKGSRTAILRELAHTVGRRGEYEDAAEELTPISGDPLASVPVIAATIATVLSPTLWRAFHAGAVGPYALTSEGWNAILSLVECGGAGSRSETNSLAQ
jgi:ATP-grasp domain